MNQRTLNDISVDLDRAGEVRDVEAMLHHAGELESLGTPEALAMAARARGSVCLQIEGNTAKASEFFHTALALYTDMNDDLGIAKSLKNLASVETELGHNERALALNNQVLELYERMGDRLNIARTKSTIGRVLFSIGNVAAAFSMYNEALHTFTEFVADSDTAFCHNNIGNLLMRSGQYPEALEHYSHALSLFEQLGDHSGLALVSDNLGLLYYMTEDYAAAIEYGERSLRLYESIGDKRNFANTLSNIGNIYVVKNDVDLGLDYYRRAHAIYTQFGSQRDISRITGLILGVLVRKGPSAEADELLARLDAMSSTNIDDSMYKEASRAMLQEYRGEFDLAKKTLLAVLAIAQERNMPFWKAGFHDQLKDLALKQNDLAAYVEHSKAYQRIIDETNGKETTARLAIQAAERKMAKERSEHEKHLAVLHSTLPKNIADRVSRGEQVTDHYDNAAIIFLDIVDFTTLSTSLESSQVVELLESIFSVLDDVCKNHDVVKIKTIGDSYMAVAFPLQSSSSEQRVASPQERAASAALEMLHAISHIVSPASSPASSPATSPVRVRIGIHSGTLTAGVLGKDRLQYDVWGDTVNVASRMESTGEPGRIHVSEAFAAFLGLRPRNDSSPLDSSKEGAVIPSAGEEWHLAFRGEIDIKGKGTMTTYWLEKTES